MFLDKEINRIFEARGCKGVDEYETQVELSGCPCCGCSDPPAEGDDVYEGYVGWPCCPQCKMV
jgi:hypothetical protein